MINEVFVIEIDKNDQILALDLGYLEIFFFFFFKTWLVGWFLFVSVNNYGHGEPWLSSSFRQ